MIALIVGGFGVGKDTVADLLIQESLKHNDCDKFEKVLSYTTREPRYEGEDTHTFCTKEEFEKFNDLIAFTSIDSYYYGARESQFDKSKVNLYCVDDKGVIDVLSSNIDDEVIVIEVIRPIWLIDVTSERLKRHRDYSDYSYDIDYRIMNDGDMGKLKTSVSDCFDFLVRMVKKNL